VIECLAVEVRISPATLQEKRGKRLTGHEFGLNEYDWIRWLRIAISEDKKP
jgi:hypothetical protein